MKAVKITSLLVIILLLTTQCVAQKTYTVQAENNDISNNLDLKAVATVFGESKNLEEFENKLNDYDSNISNLDLNNDGQVDYLRVVEDMRNNTHVVVIQAVLDTNVYQDVATIVVDKDQNNNTSVQVIGDPYIYGPNYIIEPAYYYTPNIFGFFWGENYNRWHSPYYWGYYPSYYHHHSPFALNVYMSNVYGHINHDHRYYYSNIVRNTSVLDIRTTISRNDYATRYPDHSFTSRNTDVRNKRDFEFNRNGSMRNGGNRSANNINSNENKVNRNSENTYNRSSGYTPTQRNQENSTLKRDNNNSYQNRTNTEPTNRTNNGWLNNDRNRNSNSPSNNTYTPPTNNNTRVTQPATRYDNGNQNNTIHRENPPRTSNPPVVQPRTTEQRPTPTIKPAVKEPQRETRDNSTKKDERK
ncbi:MAG: hypothetical protein WCK78_07600 [Paludibacter sp.]